MRSQLDANLDQLVTDLAADYSDRIVGGEEVPIQEYIDRLPNEVSRSAFKSLANMTRIIAMIERIREDEEIADADETIQERRHIPATSAI